MAEIAPEYRNGGSDNYRRDHRRGNSRERPRDYYDNGYDRRNGGDYRNGGGYSSRNREMRNDGYMRDGGRDGRYRNY